MGKRRRTKRTVVRYIPGRAMTRQRASRRKIAFFSFPERKGDKPTFPHGSVLRAMKRLLGMPLKSARRRRSGHRAFRRR